MIENLKRFENKKPEVVFNWNDTETEASGWLVINSLRGGAAGGGTRMRKGVKLEEVLLLAKTMEIKFLVSGPDIGGAKSGIDFNPLDPRKKDVLKRWYKAILPLLKNCYGTGGDLNVDFGKEVIPYTKQLGVAHPQVGILEGHLNGNDKEQKARNLSNGTNKIVNDVMYTPSPMRLYSVADLISGYSVAESVLHYYKILGQSYSNKTAIIQGWGQVGSAAGFYLTQAGINVIAIFDKHGGVVNESGFSHSDISQFLVERQSHKFSGHEYLSFYEMNEKFWNFSADIFIPAAASRLVTRDQLQRMIEHGLELISCGANVPFADNENFFGPIAEFADNTVSVIPDFIANCGTARLFAYLMQDDADISDHAIFSDVSRTVERALIKSFTDVENPTRITQNFLQKAIKELL